jgi:hypothetical protein
VAIGCLAVIAALAVPGTVLADSAPGTAPGTAPVSPALASTSAFRLVSLTCPDLGELTLRLRDDAPPSAASLAPGLILRIAYRARDRRTGATVTGGSATAPNTVAGSQACGQVTVQGVLAAALPGAAASPGVSATDRFDGTLTVSLVVSPSEPVATATSGTMGGAAGAAAVPGEGSALPFAGAIRSYLATRSGTASVAVYDAKTGVTYSYAAGTKFVTASIVKASILGTLLRRARDAGRSLTSAEKSLATKMIQVSDNAAATSLWNEVGKGPGVAAFLNRIGMPSTTPGVDGYWGLTTTNTPDQVKLVRTIAYPNSVLDDAGRSYAYGLIRGVTSSQRWGVTGGVPSSATVALKNGWLPRSNGWVINSIGHVRGGDRDYAIAVLSSGSPSMSYGIATVEHLSGMVWSRLPHPYRRADLYGAVAPGGASGQVELHALSNGSGYAAWASHRATGFAAATPADWVFGVAPTNGNRAPDLVGVHLRNTGSGRVEVHVLSAASGYTSFVRHAATALAAVDPAQWQFSLGPVGGDGRTDLVGVRTAATASGRVEVDILGEQSNYQSSLIHAATPVAAGDSVGATWRWLVGDGGDLVGIDHGGTGSGMTEAHVLSWSSGYTGWRLHRVTPLGQAPDGLWTFTLGDYDGNGTQDLMAILTGGSGGGMEVHVLSGSTAFTTWLRHVATPVPRPVAPAWQWTTF